MFNNKLYVQTAQLNKNMNAYDGYELTWYIIRLRT